MLMCLQQAQQQLRGLRLEPLQRQSLELVPRLDGTGSVQMTCLLKNVLSQQVHQMPCCCNAQGCLHQ